MSIISIWLATWLSYVKCCRNRRGVFMKLLIPIKPIGKGRPRMTRTGHAYTPEKTRKYERMVREAYVGECFIGKIEITITAYFKPPKSISKKKRETLIGQMYDKKPDADNIVKAVLDALNGKAYTDDKNVVRLTIAKLYHDFDALEIEIKEIT